MQAIYNTIETILSLHFSLILLRLFALYVFDTDRFLGYFNEIIFLLVYVTEKLFVNARSGGFVF